MTYSSLSRREDVAHLCLRTRLGGSQCKESMLEQK